MRHCVRATVLSISLGGSSGCFINDTDDNASDDAGDTGASTGASAADTWANVTTTSPGESGDPSGPVDATTAAESTTGEATTDDPTSTMTGCETGPLPTPIAGCTPTPPASTGDFGQDCVDRINQFRWECQCLPPLERWADAEVCTDDQSGNDQNGGGPHANFGACGEFAQNTCPNWGSESDVVVGCLQAMWDEGPGELFEAHGHYINMSSLDYTKVACGYSSSGEGLWSNQNFSS